MKDVAIESSICAVQSFQNIDMLIADRPMSVVYSILESLSTYMFHSDI